jgi:hypothetical protein
VKGWSLESGDCTKLTFVWMKVDFFYPESYVHVGFIALTIFIFLMGCQHW